MTVQSEGTKEDVYTLEDGQAVVIQWPERIDPEEYPDLAAWLEVMSRKIKRAVQMSSQSQAEQE